MYSISGEYISNKKVKEPKVTKKPENKVNKIEDMFKNFADLMQITIPELFSRLDELSQEVKILNNEVSNKENNNSNETLTNFTD